MVKPGPIPKPADKRQGRGPKHELIALDGRMQRPDPDPEWAPTVKDAWEAFWSSDVATAANPTTMPALNRLFTLYDQHERAIAATRQALVVEGSKGQMRVNPLADYALKVDTAIGKLEAEFGLTPTARARLGLSVAAAQEAIDKLTAPRPVLLESDE